MFRVIGFVDVLLAITQDARDNRRRTVRGKNAEGFQYRGFSGVVSASDEVDPAKALDPVAVATFAGLDGPGGYLTLIGPVGGLGAPLGQLLPGIRLVLVNPPTATVPGALDSLVWAGRLPVKSRSMRAVVVSGPAGLDPAWVDQAADAVLPGNRLVVEGPVHLRPDLEILMESPGLWVARKISGRPGDA